MQLNLILTGVVLLDATASAFAIPDVPALTSFHTAQHARARRGAEPDASAPSSPLSDLWRRKGGGGGGGKGGGGSSSGGSESGSGSSSSSSGSSSGEGSSSSSGKTGSSSSGGSSSSSGGRGSTSSSTGGRTTTGSGAAASYGGGRYYGGGSTVPYQAGARSTGGLVPLGLVAGASLAFWPGVWYHPAYLYPFNSSWTYDNATTNRTESKPVLCGCEEYQECGCDENNSTDYVGSVLGNGSYAQLNHTLVTVADVNGTDTILLNGTLPNGTTASGGTDSPSGGAGLRHLAEVAGHWPMAATVLTVVLLC